MKRAYWIVLALAGCGDPPDTTNYTECERHEHCPRGGQVCCDHVCVDGTACDEAPIDVVEVPQQTCNEGWTGVHCNYQVPTWCRSLVGAMGGRIPPIEAKHIFVHRDGSVRVEIDGDLGLDRSEGNLDDAISLDLATSYNGRFDLAHPSNWSDLGWVTHSAQVWADGGNYGGRYYSVAGGFSVTGTVYPNAGPFSVEIAPAFFAQVTSDNFNHLYAVDDGDCFWDQSLRLEFQCSPNCEGRVCGTDGCGGDCGQCAGDQRCTLKGDSCAEEGICQVIELSGVLTNIGWTYAGAAGAAGEITGGTYDWDVTYAGLGSNQGHDIVSFALSTYPQGAIDLATPANRGYGEHQVRLKVDGYRDFVPRSGTLVIDSSSDPKALTLHATLSNLVFEEVLWNDEGAAAPIAPALGGQCITVNVPGMLSTP